MKQIITLAFAIGLSACTAFAQNEARGPGGPGGPRGGGGPGMMPPMNVLDANTNNIIEAGEIEKASTTLLKLDKNSDGKLSADELQPQRPDGGKQPQVAAQGGAKRPAMSLIAALDSNSDGELDADEIAKAGTALKTLDKNGDGQLGRDEIMPKMTGGFGGRGGGPQGNR